MNPRPPLQPTNQSTAPRAVIYARISTEGQSENTSLAGQFAVCAQRAKDEGALVVAAFEEIRSGGLYALREQLQKALAMIEKGEAQMLILAKLDRTGRDLDDLRDVRRRVEAAGARMVFADGMTFEKGAVGNLMFNQMAAFAEFEREVIKERTSAGQKRLARSGKNPNPTPPFGYYIWKKSDVTRGLCTPEQRGTYILNEEESQWVKPIFERLARGESTRGIATWLQRQGVPTRTGTPWHPATISKIVENTVYIGRPTWGKNQRFTDESRAERGQGIHYDVPRPQEEQYVFEAPALVDEELWRRANESFKAGRAERSGRNDARYMLTGLLACPLCGRRMSTVPASMGRIDRTQRTHFYRCQGSVKRNGGAARTCELPSFVGIGLESLVIEALSELLSEPTIVEKAVKTFAAHQKQMSDQNDESARLRHIEREIATCRQREEASAKKEVEAAIKEQDGAIFAEIRHQSAQRRKELEAEQKSLTARLALKEIEAPKIEQDIAARLINAFHDEALTDIQKNAVLRPLVKVVYPRLVPPELRVSAKAWRARGCPMPPGSDGGHPFARHLGGCDIILRTNGSAVFILSRLMTGWKASRDKARRKKLVPVWENFLRVEEENPLPLQWKLPPHITTRDLGH